MIGDAAHPGPEYVLGHADHELSRLDLQGLVYRDVTRWSFRAAGVAPGMRVLDLGCGTGDVSLLAAELVGREGEVVGVDRSQEALDAAEERARAAGVQNVRFVLGEIGTAPLADEFDAVVGRFVLMHLADPAGALRGVARLLRPGGVVCFVESDMVTLRDGRRSRPSLPLYDRVVEWKYAVVSAAGADTGAGMSLPTYFATAGLPRAQARLDAPLAQATDTLALRFVAESVRSMLPMARKHGIEGFDEAGVEDLEHHLREEALSRDATLVLWPVVSAWCRLPPGSGS